MADEATSETVLRSFEALMASEPEVANGFLLAAIYATAIKSGEQPRDLIEALWKALPGADAWPALRDSLVIVLEPDELDDS